MASIRKDQCQVATTRFQNQCDERADKLYHTTQRNLRPSSTSYGLTDVMAWEHTLSHVGIPSVLRLFGPLPVIQYINPLQLTARPYNSVGTKT